MTRKFLALAVSALTAAALMAGIAALPARADIQDDVCAQMPNKLIASQAAVAQGTNTRDAATITLATKRTELDNA